MPISQLSSLRERLVTYARFAEQMIAKSRDALVHNRRDLLEDIIGRDEPRANESEMDLEEEGTSLIARHQPMAKDLRTVLMILHITNDLERMADHAVNIAEAVVDHVERPAPPPDEEVMRMFEVTLRMVDQAIQAFIGENASLAQQVCEEDGIVDGLATGVLQRLSGSMSHAPASVTHNLVLLKVAANLERIADLSTNIGEDVIYMVEGRVIKHHRGEREEGQGVTEALVEIEAKLLVPDRKTLEALRLCDRMAGLELAPGRLHSVRDTYLDTRTGALLRAGFACRRREEEGRVIMTLKGTSTAGDAIHRRRELEVALAADAPPALWPPGEARDAAVGIIGGEALVALFRIRQDRFVREACDGRRTVALVSLDEVVVEGREGGKDWREMEMELLPGGRERDLAAMIAWARARFGLAPSLMSKFERALHPDL